jgi:hypothetical protein
MPILLIFCFFNEKMAKNRVFKKKSYLIKSKVNKKVMGYDESIVL